MPYFSSKIGNLVLTIYLTKTNIFALKELAADVITENSKAVNYS